MSSVPSSRTRRAKAPFLPVQFGSCQSLLNLPVAITALAGATNGAGAWATPLALPSAPAFLGLELVAQALLLQAGGPLLGVATLRNALDFRLGT